ncbi:PKD domain-containing protein [Zunongwangia atlantica]|uniref:Lipoprotein n=1 Tax=Zunongwangia atlantica 22II14-10F7 TaxID=1185767 RepID=A0A1Y1T469_9FLAO|nr:PKD domain-containing protein [Zunongwangia atlantica]ORL45384.1 lipoprotein [Zunongwangia atlantica 22II14-10F7]
MNEILSIAGEVVDIIPNSITRTLQINDLGTAEDRQSNYSNTIKLPKTSNNQRIFNFLGVSGNTSRMPYQELPCSYTVDGIPLIVNGLAVIQATTQHYEVVIYDGLIDLAERIKGKTLSDLDYSDLNHYLTVDNYTNSFNNSEGYIYALGDFGLGRYGIKVDRQVPSIYTHTIWDKIFKEAGVNYFGDFFNENNDYLTEVITPPIGYQVENIQPEYTSIGGYVTDVASSNTRSYDYIFNADEILNYDTSFVDSRITFSDGYLLTFNNTFRTSITIDLSYTSTNGYNQFQTIYNGRIIKSYHLENGTNSSTVTINLSVNEGDELYFKISGSNSEYNQAPEGGESSIDNQYYVSYSVSGDVSIDEVTGGYLIDFSEMMGDTPVIDVVKDIMQRYGLILKPIRGSNDYSFIQFEDLLNDRAGAEDWSDKLVSITKEDYSVKYAQTNKASYQYAEDIKLPTHDGVLSINNSNADAEKILFSSPYTIPVSNRTYGGQPLYLVETWEEKDEDDTTVITPKEADISTFRLKKVNRNLTATFFDDSTAVSYSGDVPYLSLQNMEMQYFLNVYYKAFQLAINSFKEVTADVYVNDIDIYNLDFFKLKYLIQSGKYYYLNKLQYKAGNQKSKATLIEINDFSTNQPPQTLGTYTYSMGYGDERSVSINYLTTSSNPPYSDPENDPPLAVKFISGYNADIKLFNGSDEIINDSTILISDWDVKVIDQTNTTSEHSAVFEYQISDAGSESYGDEIGTFEVHVDAYVNIAPTANAGADVNVTIYSGQEQTPPFFANLNASNSTDDTTIVSYQWVIIQAPSGHTCTIDYPYNVTAQLNIPNEFQNDGTFTIELTVTDEFGATDTDTMTVNVIDETNEIPSE